MKPDTERKKYFSAKIHEKKKTLHVHLSKELRKNIKKRAIGVRKGDRVKIMRGKFAGKEATVARVSVVDRVVFLEGFNRKNSRGKEVMLKFHPSNLMLISLAETKERAALFGEVFQKAKASKADTAQKAETARKIEAGKEKISEKSVEAKNVETENVEAKNVENEKVLTR